MATNIAAETIRQLLENPETIHKNEFPIIKNIAALAGESEKQEAARELILRALENRDAFRTTKPILNSLVQQVGLYPYLDPRSLGIKDRIAYEYHRPLNMPKNFVFHREQADIYRRLLAGDSVILSAPTSFGKSRIIDAVIAAGKYDHVAIVVPTLALIDETRRRLSHFSSHYKIVTHLSQQPAQRNIFVLTPERAVSYDRFPKIQFFVIDEFYKIDALREDSARTVSINVAFQKFLKMGAQFYMLGPNIDRIPPGLEEKYRCYFYPTQFSTVVAEKFRVPRKGDNMTRLVNLCRTLKEPTLIFCKSPARVNEVVATLLEKGIGRSVENLLPAKDWACRTYHPDWIWGHALAKGIGLHHGRIPRALAQYTVRMFNDLKLDFLVCTSTLIEGVNTKAKNVIILDNEIAREQIDFFTFNNIAGRSGRMFEHFIGHVYLFSEPPAQMLPFVDFPLFTQSERTPDSLLVQIDDEDMQPHALERALKWTDQDVLPVQILRENATIDPEAQIQLASHIRENAVSASSQLCWTRVPSREQLIYACELIWKYLTEIRRSHAGIYSGRQLAFKIWELRRLPSAAARVRQELQPGKWAAKTVNEAVERVLHFERTWAGFEFPRYLMALSRIQAHVLSQRKLRSGDFSYFASQAECLFRSPVVAALDEYGIPLQIADKLGNILGTEDNLDLALSNLSRAVVSRFDLDPFEEELLGDAIMAL